MIIHSGTILVPVLVPVAAVPQAATGTGSTAFYIELSFTSSSTQACTGTHSGWLRLSRYYIDERAQHYAARSSLVTRDAAYQCLRLEGNC